jgi:predicted ArsR family transcriptional regulator
MNDDRSEFGNARSGFRNAAGLEADRRRADIVRLLLENTSMQIKDLATTLDVSLMTIHRDLNDLQNRAWSADPRSGIS